MLRTFAPLLALGLVSTIAVFGSTISVTNPLSITVAEDPGTPYPSPIEISGLANPVTSVTVTLLGYSHSFSSDVDILLVGPTGLKLLLMSDAGGEEYSLNLTFSDAAAGPLPSWGFVNGTYKPTNFPDGGTGTDIFPSPAPGGPYGTAFSVFNGSNGNGYWNLYVRDDTPIDGGSITGGWQLNVSDDVIPEPSTVVLVLAGIAGIIAGRRRQSC